MPNDDELYGRPGNEAAAGYEPMAPATPPEPKEDWEYNSDKDGIEAAANDLVKARGGEGHEPEVIDRGYQYLRGENAGSPVEADKTLDIDRAASDLARQRAAEVAHIEASEDSIIRNAVDSAKGIATESEIAEWQRSQQEQLAAQQQQQHQTEPPPPGVDAELYELLRSNPKVSAALQAEVAQVTRAQQQFADASLQNAKLAAAALVADVPELQGVDSSQYGLALQLIERSNPHKAAEIRQRFGKIEELYRISNQAREQQNKLADQQSIAQWKAWEQQESAAWERFAARPENLQRIKTVMPEAISLIAESYGITRQQLQHLQNTQPLLNSNLGQQILLDAISYRHAQKTALQNPARAPLPPVQKPGVSRGNYADSEVESAREAFRSRPGVREAARYVAAQRRANSR